MIASRIGLLLEDDLTARPSEQYKMYRALLAANRLPTTVHRRQFTD